MKQLLVVLVLSVGALAANCSNGAVPATSCSSTLGGAACAGSLGNVCVNLSWVASPTNGVTYTIYRGTASCAENLTTPLATGITTTNYQDGTVSANTDYYYIVDAVTSGGLQSTPSNEACALPPSPPSPPQTLTSTPQ